MPRLTFMVINFSCPIFVLQVKYQKNPNFASQKGFFISVSYYQFRWIIY